MCVDVSEWECVCVRERERERVRRRRRVRRRIRWRHERVSATISIDNEACRKTSAGDQHHAADHQLQNIRSKNHFFHLKNDETALFENI